MLSLKEAGLDPAVKAAWIAAGIRPPFTEPGSPPASACLTCPVFVTTAEFLPLHREHQQPALQIISAAEARSRERVAEMSRQAAANLRKVIATLESQAPGPGAAGAC